MSIHEQITNALSHDERRRVRIYRRAGHNRVHVVLDDGTEIRILHSTAIAVRRPCGTIEHDDGGWPTVTTQAAMNEVFREWGVPLYARRSRGEIHVTP